MTRKSAIASAPKLAGYFLAILAPALVTGLGHAGRPWLEGAMPTIYLAAVMVTAWCAGLGPGLVATVLGVLLSDFFFIDPRFSFAVHRVTDIVQLSVFAAVALLMNVLTDAQRRAEFAVRDGADAVRRIVEGSLDGVLTIDASGSVTGWNPQAREILRLPAAPSGETVRFMRFFPYFREQLEVAPGMGRSSRSGGVELKRRIQTTAFREDGSQFPAELALIPLGTLKEGALCAFVRDITLEKSQEEKMALLHDLLEKRVRERTAWLELVHEITRAANESETFDQALRFAGQRLCREGFWQACHVYAVAEGKVPELLPTPYYFSRDPKRFEKLRQAIQNIRPKRGEGLAGRVLETAKGEWIADLPSGPGASLLGPALEAGLRSAMAFPILVGPSVVAVVECFDDRPVGEGGMLLNLLDTLGLELGQVLGRYRLEESFTNAVWHQQQAVAQELHDGLGQSLAAVGFLGKTLAGVLRGAEELRILQQMNEAIGQSIDQIRDLAKGVSPVESRVDGLMSALAQLASRTEGVYGIRCSWECPRPVLVENDQAALHLYRIAQEAVTNAVKHAKSRVIRVELRKRVGSVLLTVRDEGQGIQGRPGARDGSGLGIMRYRARLLGGSLKIDSPLGRGTRVACSVPRSALGGRSAGMNLFPPAKPGLPLKGELEREKASTAQDPLTRSGPEESKLAFSLETMKSTTPRARPEWRDAGA